MFAGWAMIFDIIFGIFVVGLTGFATSAPIEPPEDPYRSGMAPPDDAPLAAPAGDPALPMPAAPAPAYVQDLIREELACTRAPDPTRVLMVLMQEGMVDPDERQATGSINCFPLHGATAIAGMPFDIICAGVTDAEAASLEVVYEQDPGYPGYPLISLGSRATDLAGLRAWAGENLAEGRAGAGVIDGFYTPADIPVEVFCDAPEIRSPAPAGPAAAP